MTMTSSILRLCLDLFSSITSLVLPFLQHCLYCIKILCLITVFCIHNVLWYVSRDTFYKMAKFEGHMTGLCTVVERVEDYAESLTTYAAFRVMASDLYSHATQKAFKGKTAPNAKVFMTKSKSCSITDLAQHNRPLILNFGAVTCPIFAQNLKHFNDLFSEFADFADFLIVYTRESHASNEWRFENAAHSVRQHRSIAERLHAARLVTECYNTACGVVADNITNESSLAYGALPMRLFVLYNGQVHYEGGYGPMGYNMQELKSVLEDFKRR